MYKLTKDSVIALSDEENKALFDNVYNKTNKDYHYLAFDRQLGGYNPLNVYVTNHDASIMNDEDKIINSLLEKREVCSLYPRLNLTLYPLSKFEKDGCYLDLDNIDKHFNDILELNDKTYKTKYLFVNFGQGIANYDKELLLNKLRELLAKSKVLKEVYFENTL